MIGLVVITHGHLGRELVSAAEFILGKIDQIQTLRVDSTADPKKLKKNLALAIKEVDDGDGALVLTDMFGGTPNNISLMFLEEKRVEVLTGVNLPMIIKASTSRQDASLHQLASLVCREGREAISVAGELLNS